MSKKEEVTRRQFLTYTLTGVGGFMAAGMLMPMVRFAIDPILAKGGEQDMVSVVEVDKITNVPQRVDFTVHQVDGWYESDVTQSAWVYKDEADKIVALSPVCKHLGCVVDWAKDPAHPDQFYCPCHGGRYQKSGLNIKGTPPLAPLDVYVQDVKDGVLYLGKAKPNSVK
jgi:menaquinol-cytochrome c reductase iron-sulfur subunit